MLQKLVIRNYAIIDKLSLEPDAHLNTVTGETGAGKSIILGALSLILGERADTAVLINTSEKSVVEGVFSVKDNAHFRNTLEAEGLDDDEQCIIRREIAPNGKSRAFVNDTPVNLSTLHKLASLLVDLHQQFGHLALEEDNFQVSATDAICGTATLQATYLQQYRSYKKANKDLADRLNKQALWQKEADYKQYLLTELKDAAWQPLEIEEADSKLKQMSHAGRITQVLNYATFALAEGEQPMVPELKKINNQLSGIVELVESLKPVQLRITSVYEELKDIAAELAQEATKINLDPNEMQTLQERLDLGYKLLKKHGLTDTAGLLELQQQLELELKATDEIAGEIAGLQIEVNRLFQQLSLTAAELSKKRKASIPSFEQKMDELLALVGMPNARFKVGITATEPSDTGIDHLVFQIDANKSNQFQPLAKAASGGEMSRIMLCLKSLTAKALQMPTLIFDEVDTGISGEAARQVGNLLRNLGQYHQVICITHQPQVAARGTRHFYVYKQPDGTGKINTRLKTLEEMDRVLAIARMIGGEQPSEAAIKNARELVEASGAVN